MSYFVIYNRDGDTCVHRMSKEELLNQLGSEDYYGKNVGFIRDPEAYLDTNYWDDKILIIKGEIVIPKPEKVVETFSVD